MNTNRGILTHKRWFCVLMIVVMAAVALPAFASTSGTIRNPNGGRYVNMREWNSYDAPILCVLSVGTKVEITRTDGDWHCVWANGTAGYVHSAFVNASGAGATPSYQQATVSVGPLNMREAPSMQARVITQLYNGATVSVLSYGETWTQIRSGDLYGYVLTSCLSFSSTSATPPKTPVNTVGANATIRTQNGGNLNLRASASASAPTIASYANGSRIKVLTHGDTWCRVQAGTQYGYMSAKYLQFDGWSGSVGVGGNNAVVISSGRLNLRADPSTSAKVLGQYANGTSLKVLGVGTEWHRVSVNGVTGYMMAKYVKINSDNATPHKTVANNGTFVNLRAGAGYGFDVLKRVSDGAAATVVIPYPTWSKVIVRNGSGFMSGYILNTFLK